MKKENRQCEVCDSDNKVCRKTLKNGKKMLLCQLHRERYRYNGTFYTKKELKYMNGCKICGKKEDVTESNINGNPEYYCRYHYNKLVKYGNAEFRTKNDKNEIIEHEDYIEILMYDKYGKYTSSAYVSKEHEFLIAQYKWNEIKSNKTSYAQGYYNVDGKETTIRLHQIICNKIYGEPPKGHTVDHINRNGLDNRDENLRYATDSEQQHNKSLFKNNTSGVKGVTYFNYKKTPAWIARISYNKKRIQKRFDNFEDAVNQRKLWEKLLSEGRVEFIEKGEI